ncbi:uncharacterized protein ACBT44_014577 isoform 2-T2 [Syngnathus typhle]
MQPARNPSDLDRLTTTEWGLSKTTEEMATLTRIVQQQQQQLQQQQQQLQQQQQQLQQQQQQLQQHHQLHQELVEALRDLKDLVPLAAADQSARALSTPCPAPAPGQLVDVPEPRLSNLARFDGDPNPSHLPRNQPRWASFLLT